MIHVSPTCFASSRRSIVLSSDLDVDDCHFSVACAIVNGFAMTCVINDSDNSKMKACHSVTAGTYCSNGSHPRCLNGLYHVGTNRSGFCTGTESQGCPLSTVVCGAFPFHPVPCCHQSRKLTPYGFGRFLSPPPLAQSMVFIDDGRNVGVRASRMRRAAQKSASHSSSTICGWHAANNPAGASAPFLDVSIHRFTLLILV